MRRGAAIQHLRHIASLGLGGHVAIPEMLEVLGDIVPGAFNSFFWIDPDGGLLDAYCPTVIQTVFETLIINYDQLTAADEPTFDKILQIGVDVGAAEMLHAKTDYSRSALHNEVWRPYGIGLGLDLTLRIAGRPQAILFVNRDERQSRFSPSEKATLLALRAHFAHALTGVGDIEWGVDDHEADVGVVVADRSGDIVSVSPSAFHLMLEFMDASLGPATTSLDMLRELPPPLRMLRSRLGRLRNGAASPPAAIERRTRRGVYRARAYPMADPTGRGDGELATIILTRHLPRPIGVLRRLAESPLSPRERELAYHVGMGLDPEAAARAIGVSALTGRGYLKSIYQRLDVAGRPGLVARLQGGAMP